MLRLLLLSLSAFFFFSQNMANAQNCSNCQSGPRVSTFDNPFASPNRVASLTGLGFWGWGNPFFSPFGFGYPYYWNGLGNAGFNRFAGAVPIGPQTGAFSASGGYGIGGGVYGAYRDLPVVVPKAAPRFATRDVKQHFNSVIQNPNIAIQRAYQNQARFRNW